MTEKQMDKLADIIAVRVIDKLVDKQKEWDKEFNEKFENEENSNGIMLELEMADLIKIRSTYMMTEKYELIEDIENRINNLQKRIDNL
tara:strand:+ start:1513 stop:1776 length:264 start_codon:yes stop_codon:yes gene_type:complete